MSNRAKSLLGDVYICVSSTERRDRPRRDFKADGGYLLWRKRQLIEGDGENRRPWWWWSGEASQHCEV